MIPLPECDPNRRGCAEAGTDQRREVGHGNIHWVDRCRRRFWRSNRDARLPSARVRVGWFSELGQTKARNDLGPIFLVMAFRFHKIRLGLE